jgi:hypothetical protein
MILVLSKVSITRESSWGVVRPLEAVLLNPVSSGSQPNHQHERRTTYHTVFLSFRLWYLPNLSIHTLLGPFIPQQLDHPRDGVIHHANSPPILAHGIIEDGLAKMTPCFERVSALGAEGADTGARAERDRVGCVVNMGDGVEGPGLVFHRKRTESRGGVCEGGGWRWWEGKVQSMCGETFAWGLECYRRHAECSAE